MAKSSKDKGKSKVGRPSKYLPRYDKEVYRLCLLGATNDQIADFFEVNVDSIHQWKKDHPSFSDAIKAGKTQADALVGTKLFERATGYSHKAEKVFLDRNGKIVTHEYIEHYPPDPTSMIFWLKNRNPEMWKDKQEVDVNKTITVRVAGEEEE